MARLYAVLACGGTLDGVSILSPSAARRAMRPLRRARPMFGSLEIAFGPGFQLDDPIAPPVAPTIRAVGHTGLGGSVHGYWPDLGVSFSFVTNRQCTPGDGRATSLLDALHPLVADPAVRVVTRAPLE